MTEQETPGILFSNSTYESRSKKTRCVLSLSMLMSLEKTWINAITHFLNLARPHSGIGYQISPIIQTHTQRPFMSNSKIYKINTNKNTSTSTQKQHDPTSQHWRENNEFFIKITDMTGNIYTNQAGYFPRHLISWVLTRYHFISSVWRYQSLRYCDVIWINDIYIAGNIIHYDDVTRNKYDT